MIPTREQLRAIANAPSGELSSVPFPVVMFALAVQNATVELRMKRRQLEKSIVFEGGVPVDCRSNLAHETLGRFLVASGKITGEQFNSALAASASRAIPLGEVLIERGQIAPFELFRLLQQNLARKLLDAFAWRDGEYQIMRDVPPVESPLKVKVPQLVFTGLLKFAPQEDIDSGVVPLVGKKLAVHPEPPFPLEDLRFAPAQAAVVEALRKGKRIDELAEATQMPFEEISRILYALAVIGVAVPSDQLPRTSSLPKPLSPPPPPKPEAIAQAAPAASAELDKARNELMQAYLSFRKQDPFDLLRVSEDVTPHALDEAWLAYAKRFAPWVYVDSLASLADKAQELFLAGSKAYGQLTDSEHRNSLIARRRNLRDERQRKVDAGIFRIKTDLLDSETQYQKGRALMDAAKYRDAITLLEFASDCDPQNALYRADVAYCRFLLNPAAAKQVIADLKETLRIDSECGLAWYYSGEVFAQTGNRDEAERHFRKAIKLMAPDRRPIDALKALNA